MNKLSQAQKDQFWRDGVLVLENGVDPDTLNDLKSVFTCLLYTSPSPRDRTRSRMPSSA